MNTSSSENSYDLAVIGAGSAGFSAAITAAEQGAKVILAGYGTIGGTCVNIGCVPSKTMIRAAETLHQAKVASRFRGIEASAKIVDWSKIMADKTQLVTELRQAKYIDVLPAYDSISYREGKAQVVEGGIKIDDVHYRADNVIIATGSSAFLPPIKGIDTVPYLTSTTALEIDHLPESMIVIGGGVIGCELGQMFARMGSQVTILCRSHLLPSEEPEVSQALEDAFVAEGIKVECGVAYQSITADDGICLAYEKSGQQYKLVAEQVLVTTGRRPNSAGLGLEGMGVELLPNHGIKVDTYMRTTRNDIFAVGDVTGRDMYVYMAAYGAKLAAYNALSSDEQKSYDNSAMPRITFTDPQVASVGLTEAQARNSGYGVKTSVLGLEHVPRALAARDMRGLIKLVADKANGRLIGASIIAPEGADSIQTAAIAIKVGMTSDQLGAMIFPYLTTVEGFKLAAQTFEKDVSKLSCCAG
jgi:mercury(II) reductase